MSIGQGNHMAAPENIEALNFSDQKKQNTQTKTCLGITKHTPQRKTKKNTGGVFQWKTGVLTVALQLTTHQTILVVPAQKS